MNIQEWDTRYRTGEHAAEDLFASPTPLLVQTAQKLRPGTALDIACGTGRNAIWLAEQGWRVTAVDGAPTAIEIVNQRAAERCVDIRTSVADLERLEFDIEPGSWDLIANCYYLQRSLIPAIRDGVRPAGVVVLIVHMAEPGHDVSYKRAAPGELRGFFEDWDILHYFEGRPADPTHKRPVAEVVARRPV